ncbi:protein lin-9 homolog [Leptidea sinapis]|uniref:protein lin-9 homolog n=1 Tax=Leptidea sinapis TaxID=189913 RepID=UPI002127DE3C|nr:protein lin-9 homolog [Leptidea sinapis]XP_050672665.1 protein lin-9 homolog [Leptidea sinapis]XP_050672666.1 protein lin-9 homolog [Leptidea sinapis]XP_050672667.1 protein lin-9 homolog [Leptidea sinapis]
MEMIKDEPMDSSGGDDDIPPAFCPAALGLHRVGTVLPPKPAPSEPMQKLNARGMPARIRKKNRFIFVDDFVNTSPPRQSPKRTPKILKTPVKTPNPKKEFSPSKSPVKTPRPTDKDEKSENQSPDRHSGQRIGMRLRNLLKLPKAHKWVCFEYFYSNIDKALFDGENDFMICLKESFPTLGSRKLTKVQWAKIRQMMGKPRRCSHAFFEEERKELERKRKLIRYIQQRKTGDICFKDLPNEIPMQLVVGTKVTARLRKPQDGLFTGCIDAVDTSNNTYRISFERPKLGTHSVPDYEVLSNDPPDSILLSSLTQSFRPQSILDILNCNQPSLYKKNNGRGDPLIGFNDINNQLESYPPGFLELIVKLTKLLKAKQVKINKLRELNCEAEKRKLFDEKAPEDFERKYAAIVIDLERMNMDLQEYINDIQAYCQQIAPGPSIAAMLSPSHLREKCKEEASELVALYNNNSLCLKDSNLVELITDLTALILQVKSLSNTDQNAYELSVLKGTIEQIKIKLEPKYQKIFQNSVEPHMHRIQMGLGKMLSSNLIMGS